MMTHKEREHALQQMEYVVDRFYGAAVEIGNPPFIEFAGVIATYLNLCRRAQLSGIDFTECDGHSRTKLPMDSYEFTFLAEKLHCIFGGRVKAHDGSISSAW